MVQSQAVALVQEMQKRYLAKELKSPEEVSKDLQGMLSNFLETIGQPMFKYDPLVLGEPVLSEKFNRYFQALQNDINILAEQSDYARAGTVFLFNYINTEILKAQQQNAQASNKLRTLQLYSSAQDSDVIVFGDYFLNGDQIDEGKMSAQQQAIIQFPGYLTLGKVTGDATSILNKAVVKVLDSSNGFIGNNQEIDPRSLSDNLRYTDDENRQVDYLFMGEKDNHSKLTDTTDQLPTTWIEYEHYMVTTADRLKAKGFNFTYRKTDVEDTSRDNLVDWATGPGYTVSKVTGVEAILNSIGSQPFIVEEGFIYNPGADAGVLKLDLQIDLPTTRRINTISLIPYGLKNNTNYPILVEKVETSEDGSTWVGVQPGSVWISNEKNLTTARIADNSVVGSGVWVFSQRSVKYIRFQIRQKNPVDAKVGHVYWETKKGTGKQVYDPNQLNTEGGEGRFLNLTNIEKKNVGGERKEGPIPPIGDPGMYNDPRFSVSGDLIKKTEVFNGKRWAIGIRDIVLDEVLYKPSGVIVSEPFRINGVIDRVSLEADIDIPSSFPSDDGQLWVKFFVSPDDGINWFPISRIQDDYLGIPEILAFNDPLPAEFRESGVGYHTVSGVVNSVRVKVELTRPSKAGDTSAKNTASRKDLNVSSTPVVKWYQLKVSRR